MSKKKILIADADQVGDTILRLLQRETTHRIIRSTTMADTRAWCEGGQIDLLIIDLENPGVTYGEELHARHERGETRTRVIVTSVKARTQSALQIQKGSKNFYNRLRAEVQKLSKRG